MRRGPLLMMLAGMMFTVMLVLVREARQELSALEVVWWRTIVAVPIGFLMARRSGIRVRRTGLMLVRSVLGFGAMCCFFTAARGLYIADLSLVQKLQPVLVALLARLLLGRAERVGPWVWLAVLLGFTGCVLLLAPDLKGGSWWGLWALAATVLSAAAHVAVRRLGGSEHPMAVVLWFHILVLLLSGAALPLVEGRLLPRAPGPLLPMLLSMGLAAAAGQALMTWAYKVDRAAVVAGASYVVILWAVLGDLVLYGRWPPLNGIAGGVLVVAAGALLLRPPRATRSPASSAAPPSPGEAPARALGAEKTLEGPKELPRG